MLRERKRKVKGGGINTKITKAEWKLPRENILPNALCLLLLPRANHFVTLPNPTAAPRNMLYPRNPVSSHPLTVFSLRRVTVTSQYHVAATRLLRVIELSVRE